MHRAVLLLLLAAALVSCGGDSDGERDRTLQYVAMGDSFTAAPRLPETSTDGCLRSDQNYPHLVTEARDDLRLLDVSCGGATTADVLQSQVSMDDRVHPPQIDALSAGTDVVTVGLGANDSGLAWAALYQCVQLAARDRDGAPCDRANRDLAARVDQVHKNVADILDDIARRAPDATILLVGYPRLLPETRGCPDVLPIAKGDQEFIRRMVEMLDDAMRSAAERAEVEFVDVYAASEGHDMCSDEPWVNGAKEDPDTEASPYHPQPAHQRAVADLVLDALAG